jgi:peptide/nickel transport system substrate-binding protein
MTNRSTSGVRTTRAQMIALLGGTAAAGLVAPRAAFAAPKRGGVVHMAQVADVIPSGLFGQNFPNSAIGGLIYNTLTAYDHRTLQPKPELAKAWHVSPDGLAVTLDLRTDVKFHSGRPFTSADVVFCIKNIQDPVRGSQLRSTAAVIGDVAAAGPAQVKLKLEHPVSNLFDLFEIMFIVDHETLPEMLSGKNLVGTGAFTWKQWNPGDSLTLARNPNYWKPGRPYLDGVELRVIPQTQALLAALQAGQIEVALGLAPKDVAALRSNKSFETVVSDTHGASYYVGCNVDVKPLERQQVRQAISFAIDRERIVKEVFSGLGVAQSIPWPASSPAYDKAGAMRYHYDPERAKALLKAAGAEKFETTLAINSGLGPGSPMAQIVQFNLQQVGITTTTASFDAAQFIKKLAGGTLPGLWVNVHGFGQLHPATLVTSAFPFAAAKNASNFHDPAYTAAVNRSWTATNERDERAADKQITEILLQNEFVIDCVLTSPTFVGIPALRDYTYNMFDYLNFDDATLG